jgi:assimilatory nitrate reductase catalytic subunit
MGGREVGGLANQLAAHMGLTAVEIDRVRRFWNAPRMAEREGLKAVDLFDAVARGEIKALWVMATNPAVSLPRAAFVRAALRKLELFVVSDNVVANDTANAGAHVLLPAAAWGEKDGTVTNSERRISRQRAFLKPPGDAMPDWRIVCEVARRLGFADAFSFSSAAEVLREHAALSAFENDGTRDLDLGGLAEVSDEQYAALDPVQWGGDASKRFFAAGGFFTADRRARFIAPAVPAPKAALSAEFPLRLNTGRIRDQWHTMTRSGTSPRLGAHCPEPFVALHPADAEAAGLIDGGFARVTTPYGSCVLKVAIDAGQRIGSLFAPIHWSDATAAMARVGELVMPATDPFSGQPEAKATPARIAPHAFRWRGFAVSRGSVELPAGTWWARVALVGGSGFLFATNEAPQSWRQRSLFGPDVELAEYLDEPRHVYRVAAYRQGQLAGCLFIGPADAAPQWDAVKASLGAEIVPASARRMLLSGHSADGLVEIGPLVCTCFGVGLTQIHDAIAGSAAASVDDIGRALKAGTNCGSCLPELKRIVNARVALDS